MKIVNLIENTKGSKDCLFEHGLSFYIETERHKLLVDTGATSAFMKNAETLGIDLTKVDSVILSHGHYDHAGGILSFAQINPAARIYIQKNAKNQFYHKSETEERYIGIAPEIIDLPQIIWVDGNLRIDEELFLFSGVKGKRLWPNGNKVLKYLDEGEFKQDDFSHEQYLVIETDNKNPKENILISGCAHNGILNILEEYQKLYSTNPKAVISGFHMKKKSDYTDIDISIIEETAHELKKTETRFFTGHCTGEQPFEMMSRIMEEQLIYVHSGDAVKL